MISWSESYSTSTYATIVNPLTWRDTDRIDITSASIKRTDTELRHACDIVCPFYNNEDNDIWIRIWMDVVQDGEVSHNAIFTGTTAPTSRDIDGLFITNKLTCYSVLQPAQEVLLPRGWYAPVETSVGDILRQLLSVSPAPVTIDDGLPDLKQAIIAEENENNLSMIDKILTVEGLQMSINGLGEIHIYKPDLDSYDIIYDSVLNDILECKVSETNDWYGCPNIFRASMDDVYAIARDDDPESRLSTVNRGREIWMEETDCDLNEDESLAEYAERRLKEEQRSSKTIEYNVRFSPEVSVGHIAFINYPAQKLSGKFYISSQSIDIDESVTVSEEAVSV